MQATAEGIFEVMEAQKEFFESQLTNGNHVRSPVI